jgi:hypothetical protein
VARAADDAFPAVFSFATPEFGSGLFVSLSSFQAYAGGRRGALRCDPQQCTEEHIPLAIRRKDFVFLHQKWTRKELPKVGRQSGRLCGARG